jgi:hypothetical protein
LFEVDLISSKAILPEVCTTNLSLKFKAEESSEMALSETAIIYMSASFISDKLLVMEALFLKQLIFSMLLLYIWTTFTASFCNNSFVK